ncbi:uncharacterized protein LAESUDRAFT_647386 [Laetiporus sulphureus 93-53]|uniref:HTH CENPB-type domain-containing protein n=1 Tax=Laetiporus sulphureus 93-53 TaxID=1314785 RepID=A0A165FMA7_9APHY|nr:uncharacterized protein LAESUDRAFT_647386 [Laetiporus sulphureus 93-53]KZT09186.1 hypothetical protein LAESUDRAFT_647386 [Laetiporus sulphureus 93-53]
MVGQALAATKKTQIARDEKEKLINHAIKLYQAEQLKPPEQHKQGLRRICVQVKESHRKATGKVVRLNHATLMNRVKGGRALVDFNQEKSWLTSEEVDHVITYTLELAARGFPLSHRRLQEQVKPILQAHLGPEFPETGLGENWTYRFVERHADQLKAVWS